MGSSETSAEVVKLKNHLSLLREEYVKLQGKHSELERKYAIAVAANTSGGDDGAHTSESDTFVSKLLTSVANLYDKEDYSDVLLQLSDGKCIKGMTSLYYLF